MSFSGRQRGHVKLRCPPGPLRVLGEFPQAFGGLYDNPTYSGIDGRRRKNYGRIAFSACFGIETNQTRAAQYVRCPL
jgi:hypothetical protein